MLSGFRRTIICWLVVMCTGLSVALAGDVSVKGYLIDGACVARKAHKAHALAAHSRGCLQMPACSASGYGVLSDDGQFIRFDEHGNQMARKLIKDTAKETGIKITVSGTVDGGKIAVSKIELQ